MFKQLKQNFALRPIWMNAVMGFCFFMTFIYLPWDIFIKPLAEDQEVWFGVLFYGWLAKLGALLHWFVYGAGFFGLWKMKSWLHPWIELYILQVAYSMLVWNFMATEGSALWGGIAVAAIFAFLAYGFYMKKDLFDFP